MRKAVLAAGGAVLAIALSACGGDTTGGTALPVFGNTQELVRAASAGTEKAQSAKFTFEMPMGGQKITGHGAGSFVPGQLAMSMTMDAAGKSIEMRVVDKALYMKMPNMPQGMTEPGKPWIKIDPNGKGPLSKMMGPMVEQMGKQTDPTKILERIEKAGSITKSEQTELNGQPVTHYWITLDFAKIADTQLPEGLPQEMVDKMKQQMAGVQVPAQLWLNADSLPVQVTMDMKPMAEAMAKDSGQQAAGIPMGLITMTYSDWGAPVDVQAPSADKVGELKMPQMPN